MARSPTLVLRRFDRSLNDMAKQTLELENLDNTSDRDDAQSPESAPTEMPEEIGGAPGPEPTRYGDWEKNGRCIDF